METASPATYRIALIHATSLAVAPINAVFELGWPQATRMNVLDDSLSADLSKAGTLTPALTQRFGDLAGYAVAAGADAIIFTCSAFGPAIEQAALRVSVPTLKPNESMFRQAIALAGTGSGRIALMTSFAPAGAPMLQELLEDARQQGVAVAVQEICVPEALTALNEGHADRHDQLLAAAARQMDDADVLMLGQFSMARAAKAVGAAVRCPVLTSPIAALRDVRTRLGVAEDA